MGKGPSVWLCGHATAFNSQSLAWTLHVASKPHKVQWETAETLPKVVKTSHKRQETERTSKKSRLRTSIVKES